MLTVDQTTKSLKLRSAVGRAGENRERLKPQRVTRIKVEGVLRQVIVPDGVGEVTRRMRLRVAVWMITHDAQIEYVPTARLSETKSGLLRSRPGATRVRVPAEAFLGAAR